MLYALHVGSVCLSGLLFTARGIGIYGRMAWVEARWVRIVPHLIDTVLLTSAVLLAVQIQQYPFVHGWITAKLLGLILYVVLGVLALGPSGGIAATRRPATPRDRRSAASGWPTATGTSSPIPT